MLSNSRAFLLLSTSCRDWYARSRPTAVISSRSAQDGGGGPNFSYQLRLSPAGAKPDWIPRLLAHDDPHDFRQWTFARPLKPRRGAALQARGVPAADPAAAAATTEVEPNDSMEAPPQALTVPMLLEGSIGRPGDADWFLLEVSAGRTLVFELETPDTPPPYFNPRLTIVNAAGEEVAENIYRKVDGDGDDWVKSIEPKMVYRFAHAAVYRLRLRDLTERNGGAEFRYRLMVRDPVPHIGRATVRLLGMGFLDRTLDRLNVTQGDAVRLPLIVELEEGLDAEATVALENLPAGVSAGPAYAAPMKGIYLADGEVYEGRWEGQANVHRERFRPRRRLINVLLTVAADAPPSDAPALVKVAATVSVGGKVVRKLVTQQFPLMVTAGESAGAAVSGEAVR